MKQIVETTGDFQLIDFSVVPSAVVSASRPSVVTSTSFISTRASVGQIKFLGDVPDEATDEEFAQYFKDSDGDKELAIEAYKSSFVEQVPSTPQPSRNQQQQPRSKQKVSDSFSSDAA